jgi:hypothetical protein
MNSKDFIQALRKVIREEVSVAVRNELNQFNSVITESKKKEVSKYTDSINPTKPAQRPQPNQPKQYVSNPMLNDILNETVGFKGEGPQVYLEESVDYNDMSEWPTMNVNGRMAPTTPSILTDVDGRRIDTNQLASTEAGAAVVNALTKDYSALMKAIDKKKGK